MYLHGKVVYNSINKKEISMRTYKKHFNFLVCSTLFALTACGGSGGDEAPDPPGVVNIAPTVSATSKTAPEGSDVSVTANGQDSDGTIASFSWVQKSGTSVSLTNANNATVSFTAPIVTENEEVVLTITVTDNNGGTASTDVTITITANILSVTLNGLVTDGPIANANIEVSVGNQIFNVIADDNGIYSVPLSVDDSFADQIVTLTATGTQVDSVVKLVSVLGAFGDVDAAGGDEDTVTKDKMFGVNVTNLTTANTALMEDANGGAIISSRQQFLDAAKEINSTLILPLATAIKLVIDYSADNVDLELPDGVENTFLLVSDLEIASAYVANAQVNATESYTQAQDDILSDSEVVSNGIGDTSIPIADTYYQILSESFNAGDRLILNEDGSGYNSSLLDGQSFTWLSTDTGVELTYGENGWTRSIFFSSQFVGGVTRQVETHLIQAKTNLQWITQTETTDLIVYTALNYFHYPNGELVDSDTSTSEVISIFVKEKGIVNAVDILQLGANYSLSIPTEFERIINPIQTTAPTHTVGAIDVMYTGSLDSGGEFTTQTPVINGDGVTSYTEAVDAWSVDSRGHLIIQDNGDNTDIVFLKYNDGKMPLVNVQSVGNYEDGSSFTEAVSGIMLLEESSWTSENAVGIYDLGRDFFRSLDYFWVEINSDGTSLQVSGTDYNGDGVFTEDEFFQTPTRWIINAEGNIVVRRYYSRTNFNFCVASQFEPLSSEDCSLLYHEREWDLQQITNDNDYFMRHMQRFFRDRTYPDEGTHVAWFAITDNRSWKRIAERPIELPVAVSKTGLSQSIYKHDLDNIIRQEMELEKRMIQKQ